MKIVGGFYRMGLEIFFGIILGEQLAGLAELFFAKSCMSCNLNISI